MCSLDNKIIVLNRHGWINLDRILFYNYEVQYKDDAPIKFCSRKEITEKYKITTGGIACLINDGKTGKDTSKRYKYKDFKIRQIHEPRGCLIEEREVIDHDGKVVKRRCVVKKPVLNETTLRSVPC